MKIARLFIAIALAALAASCSMPLSEETFVRRNQAVDGTYEFAVDMSYGEYSYDISFYTVMDGKGISRLPLKINLISPGGKEFTETVSMDVGNPKGDLQLYRSSLVPIEYGIWTLKITPLQEISKMRGLGVVREMKAVKRYGAR